MCRMMRCMNAILGWILVAVVPAVDAQTPNEIVGVVVDDEGRPVPNAFVVERGSGRSMVTGTAGVFTITMASSQSTLDLGVRRLGFRPLDTLVVAPGSTLRLIVARAPAALDTVRVVSRSAGEYREYLDRTGVYERMSRLVDGTFIGREEIVRRNVTRTSSLLQDAPGVRVRTANGRGGRVSVPLGRGGLCALSLAIDGQRVRYQAPPPDQLQPRIQSIYGGRGTSPVHNENDATGLFFDEVVEPQSIAMIEVYPSAAAVPASLRHLAGSCGLVAVWTDHGPDRPFPAAAASKP